MPKFHCYSEHADSIERFTVDAADRFEAAEKASAELKTSQAVYWTVVQVAAGMPIEHVHVEPTITHKAQRPQPEVTQTWIGGTGEVTGAVGSPGGRAGGGEYSAERGPHDTQVISAGGSLGGLRFNDERR
jgi:hypothetical protein